MRGAAIIADEMWTRFLLVAVGAMALATPAAANMPQVAPGRYLCRAAAGHFTKQEILPLEPGREMRIRIRLVKENFDPKWTASAMVHLGPPADKRGVSVGLANDDRTHLFVGLQEGGDRPLRFIRRLDSDGDWIMLRLKLDEQGLVAVRTESSKGEIQLPSPRPSTASLHCQSGEFDIEVSPRSYVH